VNQYRKCCGFYRKDNGDVEKVLSQTDTEVGSRPSIVKKAPSPAVTPGSVRLLTEYIRMYV